jgi:putative transposase
MWTDIRPSSRDYKIGKMQASWYKLVIRHAQVLKDLCGQFGVELVEGHAMPDHVHLCLSIPPKLSVAYTIGRLKGKSAVRIHRDFVKGRGNAKGFHFWSTGYCVSTVGLDEAKVRQYIRHQEETDRRQDEFDLDD